MGTQTYSDKKQRKREKTQKQLEKMSVQVKAILHRGPNEEELPRKEIRRFEVDANVAGSYDFLRAKIIALYPDLAEDSAFRLMWTDDEGDNVCFSTDEEYAQALKFVNGQENKLFKVMIKMPATMGPNKDKKSSSESMSFQEGVNTFAHHAQHFGEAMHTAFNPAKMAKKCEKMKAKQEFHESKAKHLNSMLKSINPQMHHHIHTVAQQMAQMSNDSHVTNVQSRADGDGDISVDIPINHNSHDNQRQRQQDCLPGSTREESNGRGLHPSLVRGRNCRQAQRGNEQDEGARIRGRVDRGAVEVGRL